jgi:16S rRNA processing protein RimM
MEKRLFSVGKIVNTQGIRGEVKIISQTDFPELRFAKGNQLIMIDPATGSQQLYYVKFTAWNNINEVEKYKGWLLKVSEDDLAKLDDEEYYYHEILGCKVVTSQGEELGTIVEILTPGANDVWVVKRAKGKDILLPVIDDVIVNVNITNKMVTIEVMEGLIDG